MAAGLGLVSAVADGLIDWIPANAGMTLCLLKSSSSSYNGYMKEINSRTAKNQFGQLLESAQRGPVRVTRRGRAVGVLLSEEQYQRLRGMAWDRLANTTAAMRKQAADSGLSSDALAELLADEG